MYSRVETHTSKQTLAAAAESNSYSVFTLRATGPGSTGGIKFFMSTILALLFNEEDVNVERERCQTDRPSPNTARLGLCERHVVRLQ